MVPSAGIDSGSRASLILFIIISTYLLILQLAVH
jgi:hypothetical protein